MLTLLLQDRPVLFSSISTMEEIDVCENNYTSYLRSQNSIEAKRAMIKQIVRAEPLGLIGRIAEKKVDNFDVTTEIIRAAAEEGKDEVLEHFSKTENCLKDGITLIHAIKHTNIDCVKVLLQAGADVNSRNDLRGTPLEYALSNGNTECIELLIKSGADVNGSTLLLQAVNERRFGILDLLIKAGADVNDANGWVETVLLRASGRCPIETIRLLVRAGADVNAVDEEQHTPLMEAIAGNTVEVVKFLIDAGADVNKPARYGYTALHTAATCRSGNDCTLVKLLLNSGAHVNVKHAFGDSALVSCIASRFHAPANYKMNYKIQMMLLAAGEIINGKSVQSYDLPNEQMRTINVPEYLLHLDLKLCLKHLCREAIRKHLLHLDPHSHLFGRVPKIGLPPSLTSYLLYEMSIKD